VGDGSTQQSEPSFRILGSIQVVAADRVVAFAGAKQRTIVAMLILDAGRAVSVERLIDGVWGDDAPDNVRATLQVHVSQIRKLLGDAHLSHLLQTRPAGYVLEIGPEETDVGRFEVGQQQARASLAAGRSDDALRLALSSLELWRGPPLGGAAPGPFVVRSIASLLERHHETVELAADAALLAGKSGLVLSRLEQLALDEPFRESTWIRWAAALYDVGRQADALDRLAVLRKTLRDELGLDPGTAVAAMETAILNHDLSSGRVEAEGHRHVGSDAYLDVTTNATRSTLPLTSARCTVGSSPDSELVIDDRSVSAVHALFERMNGVWFVEDLGSRNGTFVNGRRVVSRHAVRPGSEIRLGLARAVLRGIASAPHPQTEVIDEQPALTQTERDVLVELCRPLLETDAFASPTRTGAIAAHLGMTEEDVQSVLATLFALFATPDGPRRVAQLAAAAMTTGSVSVGDVEPRS
jgi:SARP family transcriptional regulator, regulator of embCAB operon